MLEYSSISVFYLNVQKYGVLLFDYKKDSPFSRQNRLNNEEELIDDEPESCCRGFRTKEPPPKPPGSCTAGTCRSGPQGAARCGRTGCASPAASKAVDHACCNDNAVPKNLGKPPVKQENVARTSNGGCGCKGAPSSPNANGKCQITEILNGKPSSPSPIAMGVNSLSGRSSENLGRKGSSISLDQLSSCIKNGSSSSRDQLVHAYNVLDSVTDKGTGADCIDVKCCDKLATSLASSNSLDRPASAKLETGQSSDGLENASHVIGHNGKELTNDSPQEKPARTNHVAEPTHLDVEPATESGLRT
jgi:hypothetical protein